MENLACRSITYFQETDELALPVIQTKLHNIVVHHITNHIIHAGKCTTSSKDNKGADETERFTFDR